MGESFRKAEESLRGLLEEKRLSSGDRLPAERVLAEELGISRAALRKALAGLEAEGRIWRHVGRGTFVGTRPQPMPEELASVTSVTNPGEIMETRLVLEPKLAAMAAVRATLSELTEMGNLERKSGEALNTAAFEHLDELFHGAIARAADNSLLLSLFMIIHQVRQSAVWGNLKKATLNNDNRRMYLEQHQHLLQALMDRDAAQAEKRMREHLETVRQHLLAVPYNP